MVKVFMKKSVVLLLAVAMVFSVAGCGKKDGAAKEKQKMSDEDRNAVYTYEVTNWDEEMAQNMGDVRFCGEWMYSSIYEYDDDTYESTQYFVIFDKNGQEVSRFVVPQGYDDTSSYGINQIVMVSKDEIYGVEYRYEGYMDEENGNWVSNDVFALVKMDSTGTVQWNVPLGSQGDVTADDYEYYGIDRILADGNGNIWVFDSREYSCYDKDGNKVKAIKALENVSGDIWSAKNGNFIVGQWDSEWTKIQFYEVDTKNGKILDDAKTLPVSYYSYSFYPGGNSAFDMLATNSIGIFGFNWGDEKVTKVMDYLLSDFDGTYIYNLSPVSDTQFTGSFYDEEWNLQAATFTKVPAEEVVDKYIMKLACYYFDSDIRKQVVEFNRSHEEIRITLEDYSVYSTEENWEAGIEKMKSDILAGDVADIIVAPSNLDLGMYVNKGLFADMYKLMEEDGSINKEDYLQNILALGEYNGELYELITRFYPVTLIGKTADVGEGFNWTYDDVNALMAKKGAGVSLVPVDITRSSMMYYGINLAFDQFYNSNTGECNFNSPEFVQYLELLKQQPEEIPEDYWNSDDSWTKYENQWRNGETVLRYEWIYSFRNYIENAQGYFGEPVSFVGFPTKEGSGSAASTDFTIAISEESPFKTEAWEYVSYFLKDEYQDNVESGFPVKLSSLDKKAEKERQPITWTDEETGEVHEEDNTFWIGEQEIKLTPPTEEECQYVIDFLKAIDYRQKDVADITAIIEEDSAAYFDGQKTAQQVADTIQSRVKIYVNERR